MRESELERILVDEVRKVGGRAYKWVSPGNDGVPDRIVFFPDGSVYFVELKTETGKVSAQQKIQQTRLRDLRQHVLTIRGMNALIAFFAVAGYRGTAERLRQRHEVHTT